MATQANLVLADGQATPVNQTFTPLQAYGGPQQPAVWLWKTGTTPLGYVRIEVSMRRNANGTTKVVPKVIVPYVTNDAVYGPKLISKCIYDASSGGFSIPENAVATQIANLYAFTAALYNHAVMKTWVNNMEAAT